MERIWTREHVLNVTVNLVPMFIVVFFAALFLLYQPWEQNLFMTAVSMGLHAMPFITMVLITYFAAKHVELGGEEIGEGAHAGEEGSEP